MLLLSVSTMHIEVNVEDVITKILKKIVKQSEIPQRYFAISNKITNLLFILNERLTFDNILFVKIFIEICIDFVKKISF